jgi:hypothetical protein
MLEEFHLKGIGLDKKIHRLFIAIRSTGKDYFSNHDDRGAYAHVKMRLRA